MNIDSKTFVQSNEFTDLIYKLYDHVRFPENYKFTAITERNKKFPFNKVVKKVDIELKNIIDNELANMIHSLKTIVPSFDRLWKFCWFIRCMEKIFFFHNAIDNNWYVECDMQDTKADRKFRYDDTNKEIRFTLSHNIFENDVITIQVLRKYGKEMETKYVITDGEIQYSDDSDIYLINEINRILMNYMSSTFGTIAQLIITNNFDEVSKL